MRVSRRFPRLQLAAAGLAMLCVVALGSTAFAQPAGQEWVQKSNRNAQVLLDLFARLSPESASQFGVDGFDSEILDLKPGIYERQITACDAGITELNKRLETEKDPRVRQDLEILIDQVEREKESTQLNHKLVQPYFSVTLNVYRGISGLLDDQVPAERRKAALVRLNRYAGLEKGYEPIATLAEARIRERMLPDLLPPVKAEVEKELNDATTYVSGMEDLFKKYQLKGYEKPMATLKKQLAGYDAFVRAEILPKARTDFRQPEALYQMSLREFGNKMPVPELMSRATVAFKELQNQMQALAPQVAKQKGWALTDYRDVIKELKKDQIASDAILPFYKSRLKEIEGIIRREKILTLPERQAQIEMSTAAEAAAIPAPHLRPPRMIGNTGEMGVFVLPTSIPAGQGEQKKFDDFTFAAASWTLTAHEARPGHELQFAKMLENGVSLARGVFSLNSVNVEGWGLYAEAELQPYEPLDGQLIALQHRLLRAARAFLDPGLQLGTVTKDEAYRILTRDVVMSDAMATQEVQRYTFLAPGQAPSYFVGYNRLLETRAKAERMLGDRFDRTKFNDFVLAQGLLPVELLDKTVMEEFVPQQMAAK
jgi:Bacterial protein of unknown function (DUF885)